MSRLQTGAAKNLVAHILAEQGIAYEKLTVATDLGYTEFAELIERYSRLRQLDVAQHSVAMAGAVSGFRQKACANPLTAYS